MENMENWKTMHYELSWEADASTTEQIKATNENWLMESSEQQLNGFLTECAWSYCFKGNAKLNVDAVYENHFCSFYKG